jgi:6-phosphogluconolactonase
MTKATYHWHDFADRATFTQALTQDIASALTTNAETQAQVLFGVSGGSTPLPVYQALSQHNLPWSKIKMILVDERFVPLDHADSNERNIRESFSAANIASTLIQGLYSEVTDIAIAAEKADQQLATMNQIMDVVLLGMGDDGHFASLFPTAKQFDNAIAHQGARYILPMTPMPAHAAHARLTMSLAYICRAKTIILAITGAKKREVLEQAIAHANEHALPIAALFNTNAKIEIYWSEQ